jgi:choline dehydrogenase-like flavoprotein
MFDYLIVGAGSAGSVLAARLTEDPSTSVCLVEAGEADSSVLVHCPAGLAVMAKAAQALNWRFGTVPQPGLNGRTGYQPRGRVLGGSSSINAMIYIRGQQADYDHWAAQGNAGLGLVGCAALLPEVRAQRARCRCLARDRGPAQRDGPAQPEPPVGAVRAGRPAGRGCR